MKNLFRKISCFCFGLIVLNACNNESVTVPLSTSSSDSASVQSTIVDSISKSNVQGQDSLIINEKGNKVNGLREGKWMIYNEAGNIQITGNYHQGKKEGNWITYYNNGDTLLSENFYNDQLDGVFTRYYHYGQFHVKGIYKKGKEDGEWITYLSNPNFAENGITTGEILEVHNYVDGLLDGESEEFVFAPIGGIHQKNKGKFRAGKKIGFWTYWTCNAGGWKYLTKDEGATQVP